MRFLVTVTIDAKQLREWHDGLDADVWKDAVRQDIEDAVEAAWATRPRSW